MPSVSESICCQEVDLEHVLRGQFCITGAHVYHAVPGGRRVEAAMLSLKDVRAETLFPSICRL